MKFSKEMLREKFSPGVESFLKPQAGRVAEILRKQGIYKKADRVYCGPSMLLKQVRLNVLVDGKELVMPGPGMKEGFFLIRPFAIPFKNMSMAVTYKGLARYGKRLDNSDLKGLNIDLLVDHPLMADESGFFLGDGKGFFDLALAVLAETGGLAAKFQVVAAVDDPERVVAELPRDPWDFPCNAVLTPTGFNNVEGSRSRPAIFWDRIGIDRIKRVTPLWKHYVATREKR
ncbi:MAG: 5-formyltetrahydrofolate cyclo-ligase [Proteobacteria bacterium]|nr:5-formyltetrahydrofolate cyclo-ligase [Pseudomonadota bacterium]MBU1737716.1 5-formyltetrahydrofolate cyclo-ligase [Pseudomonadota bacterium]